jgi:hypothetical protein
MVIGAMLQRINKCLVFNPEVCPIKFMQLKIDRVFILEEIRS